MNWKSHESAALPKGETSIWEVRLIHETNELIALKEMHLLHLAGLVCLVVTANSAELEASEWYGSMYMYNNNIIYSQLIV